jgi:Kef-type K+ transport system membrane component KefB
MPWQLAATSPASLIAGLVIAILLIAFGRHRDENGNTSPPKIVAAFLFGISVYTLVILIIGHFWLESMVELIKKFGEPRIAWLFVGLAADGVARLYRLFDP